MSLSDFEKITLPSDYDISRIQMTESHYEIKKRKISHGDLDKKIIPCFDFDNFKKLTENRIVFFQDKDFLGCSTVAERILRIITSQKYRSGNIHLLKLDAYKKEMLAKFQFHIDKNEPVEFMLPAFPFKVRNPLKSSRRDADLAEVASFCKFNEINLQIQKIYKPGVVFHIFHDGHLYYRHFLHTKEDADTYLNSLKNYVQKLSLDDILILRDAFVELEQFDSFKEIYQAARTEMQNFWDKEKDSNEKILAIKKSADDNINLSDIYEEVLYQIATLADDQLSKEFLGIKKEIEKRAESCAFEYMVVQHTLEKLNFFDRCVPGGVRMTVHPKEGQIGIALVKKTTYLLPWMGVGVMKKNGEVSVRYEHDVKYNPLYKAVYIESEAHPFFYEEK